MYRYNQHSFVGGQLDRGLMGRQDLERYFQGATKLENFIVRKQGNITKRRGTEMIADLADLFGTGNAIAYSRIIPFSQEITDGYYLLLAEEDSPAAGEESSSGGTTIKGAYVLSDKGLLHQVTTTKSFGDKTETSKTQHWLKTCTHDESTSTEERDVEDGMVQTWTVTETIEPFRIEVPYNGDEFKEIGFNQSGDTAFLVHKSHPPAKVVNNGEVFSYSLLDFSYQKWFPPRIISVTPSGTWGTTASTKTISYVATYVKDGIESEPSAEFQYSYKLPWGNTCSLTIKVDKGNNETEPDYYNFYKKESAEFGILATIGTPIEVAPMLLTKEGSVVPFNLGATGGAVAQKDLSVYYSFNENIFLGTRQAGSKAPYPDLIGGAVESDGEIIYDFGESSGQKITSLTVQLDAFYSRLRSESSGGRGGNRHYYISYLRYGSATHFTAEAIFTDAGKEYTTTVEANTPIAAFSGKELSAGRLSLSNGNASTSVTNPEIEYLNRSVSFDFGPFISGNSALNASQTWQIKSIKVTFYDNQTNKNKVAAYFHGTKFVNELRSADTFEDDYITPNTAFTPPVAKPHFSQPGKYPSCVATYTQRLAFAASKDQPFTWWMSCVGDLYNFNTHASIRQDDAMEVTVPATEFPNINHMVLSRDLVLFCDNGEWVVRPLSGNTLAYDTVECKKQSAIGCAKGLPPLQVGDEIIFADNSRRVVRSIKYQFTSDGYETSDLSILSQSIFFTNPVVSMCYKQHPESLILCELTDGSVAALVYMKEHNVVAWTHHTLGGSWKCRGIASNKAHADETTHVAMLVEDDNGGTEVWRIRDDDESNEFSAQLCMDGLRFAQGKEISDAAFADGQIVVDLEDGKRISSANSLVADKEYAVGYPFTSTFVSVRPEPQGAETFQWELKNAKKVHIRTLNGSSFRVKEAGMGDDYASIVDIERVIADSEVTQPGLVDATDILLNGENSRDGRIEIKHDGILPLTIESFSVDYETQPLYGSEG